MIGRLAFLVGCICAVVYAGHSGLGDGLVPVLSGDNSAAQLDGEFISPQDLAEARAANSAWYGGGHSLSRQSDGHFYADATVNGTSVNMMVDNGASLVVLTGEDALAAGLSWDRSQVQPIARGANGTIYGVNLMLDEIEIGGITQRNVAASIVPEGLHISLVGQSYLSRMQSIEIEGNQMLLVGP